MEDGGQFRQTETEKNGFVDDGRPCPALLGSLVNIYVVVVDYPDKGDGGGVMGCRLIV